MIMTIILDFDGTCVTHEFPIIGKDIGAIPVLQKIIANGHKLILFTMRCDSNENQILDDEYKIYAGNLLTQAVEWFDKHEIPLYGIQANPEQKVWTSSPKALGDLIIDDTALGCPITKKPIQFKEGTFLKNYGYSPNLSPVQIDGYCYYYPDRFYADWYEIEKLLTEKYIIK